MLNNGMAWGSQIQNFSWQNNAKQMEKSENRTPQNSAQWKKVPGLSPFSPWNSPTIIKVSTMFKDAPKYFHGWLVNIRMLSD
jgi:hypothetical protein